LDEAEAQALKGGKKLIAKLEHRVSLSLFCWDMLYFYQIYFPWSKYMIK
jgi:hypothetical protein